ncbi:MAG: PDZ domain-containing protein [Pseudomonadota bacterium]|nr:PDZ domain-containing protein [Pseudomonadota bacterium]
MSAPGDSKPRRRVWILAAATVLALTFGLWLAATVEKSPFTRSFGGRKLPRVTAGRDQREPEERRVVREGAETATIRCAYDGDGTPGSLVAMGRGDVLSSGEDLSLQVPAGSWTLYWQREGAPAVQLGRLEAEPGDVETCRLGGEGWEVVGAVRNPDGEPVANTSVFVCGARARTDESGAFTASARSGTCTVRAVYQDGLLTRRSAPVVVTAFDARSVELIVDDTPIAGMGIGFRMREDGARITLVHADTPAEEAGLAVGDIIVAIDGEPTAGLSDDAFITLGTGREGSRVDLVVERDGEERTFSFRRERLGDEDTG